MTEHIYVLAVDAGFSDAELIRHYVTTSTDFSSWWNHLPMVFMLESQLDAGTIGENLHALVPEAKFLLTEANLAVSQGWLPEVSWKWIEKRALSGAPEMSVRT